LSPPAARHSISRPIEGSRGHFSAGYTIDATSEVSFEAAVRQNLDGVWMKGQYSEAVGAHWRATLAGAAIGGAERDFIGQYRRNSHVLATLRYSF
jgi:hypothetical protein